MYARKKKSNPAIFIAALADASHCVSSDNAMHCYFAIQDKQKKDFVYQTQAINALTIMELLL